MIRCIWPLTALVASSSATAAMVSASNGIESIRGGDRRQNSPGFRKQCRIGPDLRRDGAMNTQRPAILYVLSGPSGVGKDTVIAALRQQEPDVHYAVTATTRPPRPGEIDTVDYYFLTL